MPKLFNPADFLIKIAIDPTLVNPMLTIESLVFEQNIFYDQQVLSLPKMHMKGL